MMAAETEQVDLPQYWFLLLSGGPIEGLSKITQTTQTRQILHVSAIPELAT